MIFDGPSKNCKVSRVLHLVRNPYEGTKVLLYVQSGVKPEKRQREALEVAQ